ncbi:MAG TPA: SRPBCC domain-containing protein [Puia sp.]|nr:SRPBCC domain-containing protein [Puia sp.]
MNLLFDFTVDKAAKTIYITREFAADQDLVWDAFTKAEFLDKWQAPKPYTLYTKEMDFRVGGRWLYAMVAPGMSPETAHQYSMVEYLEIRPKTSFSTRNTFADENGNPRTNAFSLVKNTFKQGNGITTVYIEKRFEDLAVLEMMATLGFKEGTIAGFGNLDELFRNLVTSK